MMKCFSGLFRCLWVCSLLPMQYLSRSLSLPLLFHQQTLWCYTNGSIPHNFSSDHFSMPYSSNSASQHQNTFSAVTKHQSSPREDHPHYLGTWFTHIKHVRTHSAASHTHPLLSLSKMSSCLSETDAYLCIHFLIILFLHFSPSVSHSLLRLWAPAIA